MPSVAAKLPEPKVNELSNPPNGVGTIGVSNMTACLRFAPITDCTGTRERGEELSTDGGVEYELKLKLGVAFPSGSTGV